jgi:cyclic beta-1,2-glucan synthetase
MARWISRPSPVPFLPPISGADAQALRLIARRTWRFFETFVTAEDHMLPPDNFQEEPLPVVAHRTSPTNLGLYLLSVAAACDFGWLGMFETAERLEAALETMNKLERFRGHFYNWYDTRDLRPLDPKYISSVDSGNLAGHLIVLGNACRELATRSMMGTQSLMGIGDSLELMREALREAPDDPGSDTRNHLNEELDSLATLLGSARSTPAGIVRRLKELALHAKTVADIARERNAAGPDGTSWANAIYACVLSHQRDLETLMPWAVLIASDNAAAPSDTLAALLATMPALADLAELCTAAISILMRERAQLAVVSDPDRDALIDGFRRSGQAVASFEGRLVTLAELAKELFEAMDFGFLFDPERELLSIGCRVEDGSLDPNYYDLLASEARLASFVAIAKGDLPTRHWFRLGRALTPVGYGSALISWSGSMFEYLMPSLVMRAPAGSLLEQTTRQAVRQQMKFGAIRGVPWGISESAYNARDLELTYQYSSFGLPSLGLKRGLGDSTVVAPYATALAAMVDPRAATRNFLRLAKLGGRAGMAGMRR